MEMLSPCQRQINGADAMQRRRFTGCAPYMQPIFVQTCLWMLCCAAVAHTEAVPQQESLSHTRLAGKVELARLVDRCAQRLQLKIEYDAKTVQGAKVTLRLAESVANDELWALTNQLSATRGLTSIQPPGQEQVLSIVKLTDAVSLARVEQVVPPETLAGFATVVAQVEHRPVKDVIEAMKPLLSKPGVLDREETLKLPAWGKTVR